MLFVAYGKEFSDGSFGFRPGRSAHQALRRVQEHLNAGYVYAVDIDPERFFDTVSQSKLIEVMSRRIRDSRVISLIHSYLKSGVTVDMKYGQSEEGVPQGSPLSPLPGNIMLNEPDKELERRGHPFVRYTDNGLNFMSEQTGSRAREEEHNPLYRGKTPPARKPRKDGQRQYQRDEVLRLRILPQQE
jgi:retron-type reverse transcriptase